MAEVPAKKPTQGRFHKDPAVAAQRQMEKEYILECKLRGWSDQKVADSFPDKFGYTITRTTVANRYKERLLDVEIPMIDDLRKQEILRLDRYLDKLDAKIEEGDPQALGVAIRVAERRSRLLGADAPQQTEVLVHTISHEQTPLAVLIEQRKAEQVAIEASLSVDPEDDDTQSRSG